MRKIFTLLFFIAFFCPLFAEIDYSLIDENLMEEINREINQSLQQNNNLTYHLDPSANSSYFSTVKVNFTITSVIESKGVTKTVTSNSDCIGVILDKSWVLSSGHCFFDKNIQNKNLDELYNIDRIIEINYSNFSVKFNNKDIKVIPHRLSNLYLFQLVNEDNSPYELQNIPFANLIISTSKYRGQLINSLNEGRILINRTLWHTPSAIYTDSFLEHDFYPYAINRELLPRHIKDIVISGNTNIMTAILSGIAKHRAGDPLFYIGHGKEYVMGFGNTLNIPDNIYQSDLCRTHEIALFSLNDRNEIVETIRTVDQAAAQIISQNIVFK